MSRNKLRVGVIGVGYVASNNFLPVFQDLMMWSCLGSWQIILRVPKGATSVRRPTGSAVSGRTCKARFRLCLCAYPKGMPC